MIEVVMMTHARRNRDEWNGNEWIVLHDRVIVLFCAYMCQATVSECCTTSTQKQCRFIQVVLLLLVVIVCGQTVFAMGSCCYSRTRVYLHVLFAKRKHSFTCVFKYASHALWHQVCICVMCSQHLPLPKRLLCLCVWQRVQGVCTRCVYRVCVQTMLPHHTINTDNTIPTNTRLMHLHTSRPTLPQPHPHTYTMLPLPVPVPLAAVIVHY